MPERTVTIASAHGLHARPASLFVQAVTASGLPVELTKGEKTLNAASILGVISLGINHGDQITLKAEGEGADSVLDSLVELLRDRTVRPLTLATRAVVFGIIVFAAAVVTVVLLSITLIRLLTVYAFDGRVWLSDLVVGVLFVVAGLVAWSQRSDPNATSEGAE